MTTPTLTPAGEATPGPSSRPAPQVGTSGPWTAWAKQRPTETKALYRWRVPARMVCGGMLAPEWSDNLVFCGMGYADHEWWPAGSRWDGYNRTVAKGLEWRPAEEGETEVKWVGLDLLPCPFTGNPPRIEFQSQWVGALPYQAESLILHSVLGTSYRWSVPRLLAVWNRRVQPDEVAARSALAIAQGAAPAGGANPEENAHG